MGAAFEEAADVLDVDAFEDSELGELCGVQRHPPMVAGCGPEINVTENGPHRRRNPPVTLRFRVASSNKVR